MKWPWTARAARRPVDVLGRRDGAAFESAALAADVDTEVLRHIVHNDLIGLIPRPYTEAGLVANVATFVGGGPITVCDLDVPPTATLTGMWIPTTRQLFISPHYEDSLRVFVLCHELTRIIRDHKATLGSRAEMSQAMKEAATATDMGDVADHFAALMYRAGALTRCRNFDTHDEFEAEYMGTVIARLILQPPPSREVSYISRALS